MNPQNIYIGMRYVPKYMGAWDENTEYEPLSIVLGTDGNGYTSKKPVPAGTPTSNTDYWALTGSGNSVVDNLSNKVNNIETDTNQNKTDIDTIKNSIWWEDNLELKNDGVTDNTNAFNALTEPGFIVLKKGIYKINGNISVNTTIVFEPGAIIYYSKPVTEPDINNWIKAIFNGGFIFGDNPIFDGAIVPCKNNIIMEEVNFSWWKNDNSAEQNSGILNLIYSTSDTPSTVKINFNKKEYNIKPSTVYATNATDNNDVIIEDSIHFKCAGNIQLPTGKYYNVTFESTNDNSAIGYMNCKTEHKCFFKNCKFIGTQIGARNTVIAIFNECEFNFKSMTSDTSTLFSITNDLTIKDCKFIFDMESTANDYDLFNYSGNPNKTEVIVSINGIDMKLNSGIASTGAIFKSNPPQMKTIFTIENLVNDGFGMFLSGGAAASTYTVFDIKNIKFNNTIFSLIDCSHLWITLKNVTVSFAKTNNNYEFIKQTSDKGSIYCENITVQTASGDFKVIVNSKMTNSNLTQNMFINFISPFPVNADGGFFINAYMHRNAQNFRGINIFYDKDSKLYEFYPENKTITGYALTGNNTTLSKGSSTPMQLELVKLYSDGTYENVGAPTEANVRVIGNNSEQTIYNGSGTLRIGSDETAKAIMLTYSGSDSNNMIASMVITIT